MRSQGCHFKVLKSVKVYLVPRGRSNPCGLLPTEHVVRSVGHQLHKAETCICCSIRPCRYEVQMVRTQEVTQVMVDRYACCKLKYASSQVHVGR